MKLEVLLVFAVLVALFRQQYLLCILKSHAELATCFILSSLVLILVTSFHPPILV
jgi:hypothetical protein